MDADETLADDAVTDWAVWQLVDPLLPTGGFAHSQGLEAAAHAGLVAGGDERHSPRRRRRVVRGDVRHRGVSQRGVHVHPFRRGGAIHVRAREAATGTSGRRSAGLAAQTPEPPSPRPVATWRSLDDRAGACLAGNRVASRASTATGAALLRAVTAAFGDAESGGPGPDGGGVSTLRRARSRFCFCAAVAAPLVSDETSRRPSGDVLRRGGGFARLVVRARGSSVCLSHPSRHAQRGDAAQSRGSSSRRGVLRRVFWASRGLAPGGGCARGARGWRRGGARRVRRRRRRGRAAGALAARGRRPGRTRRALLPTLLQLNRD